jgi:hypothetical protein
LPGSRTDRKNRGEIGQRGGDRKSEAYTAGEARMAELEKAASFKPETALRRLEPLLEDARQRGDIDFTSRVLSKISTKRREQQVEANARYRVPQGSGGGGGSEMRDMFTLTKTNLAGEDKKEVLAQLKKEVQAVKEARQTDYVPKDEWTKLEKQSADKSEDFGTKKGGFTSGIRKEASVNPDGTRNFTPDATAPPRGNDSSGTARGELKWRQYIVRGNWQEILDTYPKGLLEVAARKKVDGISDKDFYRLVEIEKRMKLLLNGARKEKKRKFGVFDDYFVTRREYANARGRKQR